MIIHTWDVGFSKSKIVEFHGLGWVSMLDVWVAFTRRLDWFARKEQGVPVYGLSCFIYL
jgi:hypothetical protein